MRLRSTLIIAIDLALIAIFAGSVAILGRNSRNFLLAERQASLHELTTGELVDFSGSKQSRVLLGGWGRTQWGAVTDYRMAELALKLPRGLSSIIGLDSLVLKDTPSDRRVRVSLDGQPVALVTFSGSQGNQECTWTVSLPPAGRSLSVLGFAIVPDDAVERGRPLPDEDRLLLGLGLRRLTLMSTASPPHCDGDAGVTVSQPQLSAQIDQNIHP